MALSTISSSGITDATIATGDLADDAVTAAKIADAVGLGKLVKLLQLLMLQSQTIIQPLLLLRD